MYFIHELGRVMMMKILIVEDDKDIVAVISEELKQWGYETCSIHDFNAVLEEFREHTPQLILMDIIGLKRFVKSLAYRLFLYLHIVMTWIWLWQCSVGQMII